MMSNIMIVVRFFAGLDSCYRCDIVHKQFVKIKKLNFLWFSIEIVWD